MNTNSLYRKTSSVVLWALTLPLFAGVLNAGVTEVYIAVTPTCPHGVSACYPGVALAFPQLEGIEAVASHPDAYNCMAQVWLKEASLPDVKKWVQQLKSMVGDSFVFRGVE